MAKKILAILLALSFVFAFAACGGNGDDATTTAPVETTEDPFAEVDDTDAATEIATEAATDAATEIATEAVSENTTVADTSDVSAEETTEAANAMPQTKEEIVAYFNTAINSAKKDSKSIHSNYMVHSVAGEIENVPGWLEAVIPGSATEFVAGFMGADDSKANVTWTSAADKNAFFPVEGETWASKLTAADVKDAKITEKDGKWLIRITTVADAKSSNIKHGQGHAPKAFNVVTPATINDNLPSFLSMFGVGTAEMNYPSSTVNVTVDPATGHVLSANYMMYWTINLPVNDAVVILPFSTENDYNINW
ncbi:MAG: hypothetical protein IJE72_03565 [Clostridia bacterium]|nr:hypothetical protein [Clostridia bacterium]